MYSYSTLKSEKKSILKKCCVSSSFRVIRILSLFQWGGAAGSLEWEEARWAHSFQRCACHPAAFIKIALRSNLWISQKFSKKIFCSVFYQDYDLLFLILKNGYSMKKSWNSAKLNTRICTLDFFYPLLLPQIPTKIEGKIQLFTCDDSIIIISHIATHIYQPRDSKFHLIKKFSFHL